MAKAVYEHVSKEEVEETSKNDPLRAVLMVVANSTLDQAELQAKGAARQPAYHDAGWYLSLHDRTPDSLVGLWSCWLANQFYLGYPKNTSYIVRNLSREQILKVANSYRESHADKFSPPAKKPFDYRESRLLLTGFPKHELEFWLNECGVPIVNSNEHGVWDVWDEVIMKTLDVTRSEAVKNVSAVAVGSMEYTGEYKDADKPLEKNEAGQTIAYKDAGLRRWAKFYAPQLPGGKGRVWVDKSDFDSYSHHFPFIDSNGNLQDAYYGHDYSNGICTERFNNFNKYAPDGPSAESEAIQTYRDKFIRLLVKASILVGKPRFVTVDYGFDMVPEDLEKEGYKDITWLKGKKGVRKGWGNELVRGRKENEMVILKSGNSLVPWSTIRQVKIPEKWNEESLYELAQDVLTF